MRTVSHNRFYYTSKPECALPGDNVCACIYLHGHFPIHVCTATIYTRKILQQHKAEYANEYVLTLCSIMLFLEVIDCAAGQHHNDHTALQQPAPASAAHFNSQCDQGGEVCKHVCRKRSDLVAVKISAQAQQGESAARSHIMLYQTKVPSIMHPI